MATEAFVTRQCDRIDQTTGLPLFASALADLPKMIRANDPQLPLGIIALAIVPDPLYLRQSAQLPGLASEAFIAALPLLGAKERIPRFDEVNERLHRATRWQLVAVPGLIPEEAFFSLLAARKFPVTDWIRRPEEFEYIVEPDVFHDLFGHVPLLFNPMLADYMQRYGEGGLKAARLGSCEMLARLYWYTIEFGLLQQHGGLRLYGAGIASSYAETRFCLDDASPHRIGLTLERVMRTHYRIDDFQEAYFVIRDLDALLEFTRIDFAPLYEHVQQLPELQPGELLEDDLVFTRGSGRYHAARRKACRDTAARG